MDSDRHFSNYFVGLDWDFQVWKFSFAESSHYHWTNGFLLHPYTQIKPISRPCHAQWTFLSKVLVFIKRKGSGKKASHNRLLVYPFILFLVADRLSKKLYLVNLI